jgi:hypothetical protein
MRAEPAALAGTAVPFRIRPAFFRFGLYTHPLVQYRD